MATAVSQPKQDLRWARRMSIFDDAKFAAAIAAMRAFAGENRSASDCIIVCGYPKSGNTLTRFVYHNLIRVTNGTATETLTYSELNAANPNHGFPQSLIDAGFKTPVGIDHRGFALLFHAHAAWSPEWREVGPTLFVYRDPLDALIGTWYATVDFPVEGDNREPIDAFVLRNLPRWIDMYTRSAGGADAVLRYEAVMQDDEGEFARAFTQLGIRFDPSALKRAVEMSRFDRIREMEDRHGQQHGHRANAEHNRRFGLPGWRDEASVRFTRSGKSAQWRWELQPQTIDQARAILDAEGLSGLLNR